jgi:ribosomal-protein-alanine N-acetyltransferase
VEDLEKACFDNPWGDLDDSEHLWAIPRAGFARWLVIDVAQEAELIRLAVAAPFRRTGQGRMLLRFSQARLATMGILVAHLEVRVSNAGARSLYEQEGWDFQGLREGYYRDGEDAALYRREL